MIIANKLSYSFPQKDLYDKVSFHIEEDQHCAFIGTNGTGKSTLIDIIRNPENHLYDGKVTVTREHRIGYVSQFSKFDEKEDMTVFAYISQEFVRMQENINAICEEMAEAADMEEVFERYQRALDEFDAVDGEHYDSNIRKRLKVAGLEKLADLAMTKLSGGEWKLVQVIREMLLSPKFLIMDEPDGFLDFEHLNGLKDLINGHKGTLLVITHNRYLLNHCFNKILHLENGQIQEFDGNYLEYNLAMLRKKIEMQELAAADTAEIERNQKLVEKLRNEATAIDSATKGRTLHARVTMLESLEARRTKEPFVDIPEPEIDLHTESAIEDADTKVLTLQDYSVSFGETLLEHVDFALQAGEKVALVGPNGTGKTTLLREIYKQEKKSILLDEKVQLSYLSQVQGETIDETHTVKQELEELGFEKDEEICDYLALYGFSEEYLNSKIGTLSGGEKNLLQLAKIAVNTGNLLLLDEPTSHLDLYSQIALERSMAEYNGSIFMVSHDFYTIANCMDYVLLLEDKTLRKISIRKFRKMIYAEHFDKDYLEHEQQKKEMETKVTQALKNKNYEKAKELCDKLEEIIKTL